MFAFLGGSLVPRLVSFDVTDTGVSPLIGDFDAAWIYSGYKAGYLIFIDYSFTSDTGPWTQILASRDPDTVPYSGSVNGEVGFTSLDNTWFRVRLERSSVQATNSPLTDSPPYPT